MSSDASLSTLDGRLRVLAAHISAALAELATLAAAHEAGGDWAEGGIRSCAHWLAINAGLDLRTGAELLRVGRALPGLPLLAAAFAGGELSFDKMRALTLVACPEDEELWLEVGRQASGSQLARLCREYRRAAEAHEAELAEEKAEEQLARRGLWTHWEEGGMLRLEALLGPEDGSLVLRALEAIGRARGLSPDRGAAQPPLDGVVAGPLLDPAWDGWAAARADALVAMGAEALAGAQEPDRGEGPHARGGRAAVQMVVHVDLGVLTGEAPGGRCHVEGGPALSEAAVRRLTCDGRVQALLESEGLPVDAGPSRRIVSARQRRVLQSRDGGCRFPGCGVAAGHTQAHHLQHWAQGGKTELGNLLSLCWFHHRRLHEGAYRIRRGPGGTLCFERPCGRPLSPSPLPIDPRRGGSVHLRRRRGVRGRPIGPETPAAVGGGEPFDHEYAVSVLADAAARLHAGADPHVLTQVTAARAALEGVALQLLADHTEHCVAEAIQAGGGEEKLRELNDAVTRMVRS